MPPLRTKIRTSSSALQQKFYAPSKWKIPFHFVDPVPIISTIEARKEEPPMQEETSTDVQNVDELMQRITEAYDTLPRQLKSVATYIEQHRSNVMMDRTSDIASACGVHPSAVVRFAQRFGFSGFSRFAGGVQAGLHRRRAARRRAISSASAS